MYNTYIYISIYYIYIYNIYIYINENATLRSFLGWSLMAQTCSSFYHLDVHFNRLVDPAVRATGGHVLMRSPESLCGNHCEHAWFEFNHIYRKLLFSSGAPSEIDQLSELPTPVCRRHTLNIAVVPTVVQCGGCCSSILVPFYAPILLVNSSLILYNSVLHCGA